MVADIYKMNHIESQAVLDDSKTLQGQAETIHAYNMEYIIT